MQDKRTLLGKVVSTSVPQNLHTFAHDESALLTMLSAGCDSKKYLLLNEIQDVDLGNTYSIDSSCAQ